MKIEERIPRPVELGAEEDYEEILAALLAEDPAIAGAAVLGPHGNNKPFYISADSPAIRDVLLFPTMKTLE